MTSDNKQHLTFNRKNIFAICAFSLLYVICYMLYARTSVRAATRYPIRDLGNCRNARECRFYCEIPENSPACWSYGKYVMNPDNRVLGETTINLTYPIADLGNCTDATNCFVYCNQPQNQGKCLQYAKSHGLVKEGTADSGKEIPEAKIIEAAKTEL